jgi:hypothetical protein
MELKGKTALITGASGGIGYDLAGLLAKEGCNLILVARSSEKMISLANALEKQYGIKIHVITKDLSYAESANELYREIAGSGLQVDTLINNAGFGNWGLFAETNLEKELSMIDLNVRTLTVLTKLFLQPMLQRKSGHILNVASTAAFQPGPYMAVYYATKAYVLSFTEALSEELKGTGISVTTLCPGPTETGFGKTAEIEKSKFFTSLKVVKSSDVASFALKALKRKKRLAIHGTMNRLIVWINRFTPRFIVLRMVYKMSEPKK